MELNGDGLFSGTILAFTWWDCGRNLEDLGLDSQYPLSLLKCKPVYLPHTSTEYYYYKSMFAVNGDFPQLQIVNMAKYNEMYKKLPAFIKTHSQHPRNPSSQKSPNGPD